MDNINTWTGLHVEESIRMTDKNSSGNEIANVNFLRRYGTYILQNTNKNSSGDEIANVLVNDDIAHT